MRIGLLGYPSSGGSGVVAAELGMALAARGHEVHFFSLRPPFRLRPHSPRFRFHEIVVPRYPLFEHPSYGMAAASQAAEVRLDLLHAHYAYPHALSAHLAREMSGRDFRTVATLHGTDVLLAKQDASLARATRFGLSRCDAVSAVSRFMADKARAWFDLKGPLHVVPDFVDTRRFRPARRRSAEAVVLQISNFRPVKRSEDALRVLSLVRRRRPARLVFLGSGEGREELRALAGRLGVARWVEFAGEDPDVARHLKAASLLLSTSEFEGFGMAVLEAMACGLPVVATDSGGVREVASASCARIRPVGDLEGLAEDVIEVLGDPELASAMGAAGRRRAEELFDAEQVVPQYERLYHRVIGANHAEDLSV
jgi:N-acetyl-alpha-D-glucosaminyl L-malate synthase BshA